jgi:hypothetical protein
MRQSQPTPIDWNAALPKRTVLESKSNVFHHLSALLYHQQQQQQPLLLNDKDNDAVLLLYLNDTND